MRTVVFVQRQELELKGNLSPNALVLGDVDNDSAFELAVGSLDGDLLIFKGEETIPIASASGLGTITCVGIGDICNEGKNSVFTMSAEGYFYIFSVTEAGSSKDESTKEEKEGETADAGEDKLPGSQEQYKMEEIHKQQLPANSKVVLLADIDLDNSLELVVGFTDRKVRAYRWQTFVMEKDGEDLTFEKLVLLQMWVLPGQIGSLSLSRHSDNFPKLVVSQPGCNYAELSCDWVARSKGKDGESLTETVVHHPITNKRARNANISTEIVANVSKGDESKQISDHLESDRFAMCTLDGTLMLIEEDRILWSLLVDHQLFAITKLDIMCDGHDEVVSCALDGETYIVDHNRQSVRFHFEESVCAFTAGLYSMDGETNPPCLVYGTFNNKIYIYWNVCLPGISSLTLLDVLKKNKNFQEKLKAEGIEVNDQEGMRQIVQHYMYERPGIAKRLKIQQTVGESTVQSDRNTDDLHREEGVGGDPNVQSERRTDDLSRDDGVGGDGTIHSERTMDDSGREVEVGGDNIQSDRRTSDLDRDEGVAEVQVQLESVALGGKET